jgi:hypothetical protein
VVGNLLGRLQLAAVLHVGGDASCPEGVITNLRFDLRSFRPALNPRLLEGRTLAP